MLANQMFDGTAKFSAKFVGPKIHTGECWLGVHGKAEKLIGFESRNRGDSVRLSPKFVAGKYRWRWTAGECWSGVH